MGSSQWPTCGRVHDVACDETYWLDAQKKTPQATERERTDVVEKRKAFAEQLTSLDASKLVFVDESGFRLGSMTTYGWSPRGHDANGKYVAGQWTNMTILGAIALDGHRGMMSIDAATSGDVFLAYVTQVLIPNLKRDDIVVMDNLAAHKRADIRLAIESCGAKVLFLPPYSPEYNPIERMWSKLKTLLRRCQTSTKAAFDVALTNALELITVNDIAAWTTYAGYTI